MSSLDRSGRCDRLLCIEPHSLDRRADHLPLRVIAIDDFLDGVMCNRKYLPKILPLIGATSLGKIFSFDVAQLAKELFPAHINSIRSGCWMLLLLANREITRPTLTVHKPSHQHLENR